MALGAFASVEGVISDNPELLGIELDIAARKALATIVNDVIIPEAAQNAPGSVGPQITMGQVEQNGVGVYAVDILVPEQYRATEEGSGIYGSNGTYDVSPKASQGPRGVLLTADGVYIKHATQVGQPGQRYIYNAVEAHLQDVALEIFRELRQGLATQVRGSE